MAEAQEMISIREAAARGIEKVRDPHWHHGDYIKIDIIDGAPGPWLHLYSPLNVRLHGRDPYSFPVFLGWVDLDARSCIPCEPSSS
jgi:hypothetical protein